MNATSFAARLLPVLLLLALPATAVEVDVTVEILSPEDGAFLAPFWVGFHDGSFDTYDLGASAALFPGLEELAEDGNTSVLAADFASGFPGSAQATLTGPPGPLPPGTIATARFDLDPSLAYFSYASMILPSNDAFVSNGNPLAHRVFDPAGHFTPKTFYIFGREVNDAGTEVNDEIPANTAGLGQMSPDTGTDEGGVVSTHPGFVEGGNILTARPGADFTRPGYRVAKVTIEAVRTERIHFTGDAGQETEPVASDATAACWAVLSSDGSEVTVSCEHDVEDVAAAHVHEAPAGSAGPVIFPFDDPTSPFSQTFDLDADTRAALFAGDLYVNIHSPTFPNGEVRGQIVGCVEGPTTLCLQDDQFEVAVDWQSADGAGVGRSVPATNVGGFFYFFSEENLEVDVKILDGCSINGHYWVFAAGLTDVATSLTVTRVEDGADKSYGNALGEAFDLVRDLEAFPCP